MAAHALECIWLCTIVLSDNQTASHTGLIWAFAGRTYHNVGDLMHWLNLKENNMVINNR